MLQRAVAVLLLAACASFAAAELNGAWTRLNELGGAVRAATSALSGSSSSIAAEIKTFNLTMRDGVKLWTRVADLQKPGRYPTVLIRSPYGPTGTENLDDLYLPFDFVVVQQNQRGTGDSQGNFTFWATCPDDEQDTLSWIGQQPWSNGDIYVVGASADGINMEIAMRKPQAEKGQWAIFCTGLAYGAPWQDGALRYALAHVWLAGMQRSRPHAPNYFNTTLLPNEGYSSWWANRSLDNFDNINFKGVHWGGWYDIFLQPMIETWTGYNFHSNAVGQHKLIIGPRGHCLKPFPLLFPDDRLADIWAYETSVMIFKNDSLSSELSPQHQQIFRDTASNLLGSPDHYRSAKDLDMVSLYIMGPSRGEPPIAGNDNGIVDPDAPLINVTGLYWTTLPYFPNATGVDMFLEADGKLTPKLSETTQVRSFNYNPADPVPTLGGNNLEIACGPLDQRKVEGREDVVVFTTEPFEEDTPVVGRINVTLFVSSNCTDTDFTVKITDVYPESRGSASILVGDSIQRMRWRDGVENPPKNMTIGEVYEISIALWPTAYVFNKGHSLRLAVSSSNYPRFSATPNNGRYIVDGGPQLVANNTLHMGGSYKTRVTLPVVPFSAIPPNIAPKP